VSGTSGSYNAVTWLLDRNIDEGRGGQARLHRYRLRTHLRRSAEAKLPGANMLRRLGVRREERVAMIMLDTVDFRACFLGAIRAGIVPVPLNTLLTSDQYAYVLADSRARVCSRPRRCIPSSRTSWASCRTSNMSWCPAATRSATRSSPTSSPRKPIPSRPCLPCRGAGILALFLRLTGMPKGVRHLHSNLQATAETYGRQVLGIKEKRRLPLRGKTCISPTGSATP
jgi:4-hydroxybenzoate-CoA ligase